MGEALSRFSWERYWFPQATAVRLAVLRIVAVAAQLLVFRESLDHAVELLVGNTGFNNPQVFIAAISAVVGEQTLRSVTLFTALWWVMIGCGVAALIGLLTRPAVFVFATCNWLFVAHAYSYGEKHHPEAIFCLFLMLLAFAPCNRALSVDAWIARRREAVDGWGKVALFTTTMWPLMVIQWMLAMAYLCAGLCKIKTGGLDWFNGYTLQTYLLQDGIRWGSPLGVWLAKQHAFCVVASIGAVFFEACFPVILIFRRLAPVFLLALAGMHIGIYITQGAPFFQFMVLYLAWVPFERLPGIGGKSGVV